MGYCDTPGFVRYHLIHGSVMVYTLYWCSVCRFRYGAGKPNLWSTHGKPYPQVLNP